MILFIFINKLKNASFLMRVIFGWKKLKMLYLMLHYMLRSHDAICKLVDIHLIRKLSNIIGKKNIDLCKDDRLSVIENVNGPKLDPLRKDVLTIFDNEELKINIDTNLTTTNFLNVALDLCILIENQKIAHL